MIYWIIIFLLIANFVYECVLARLNELSVRNTKIPECLKDVYKPSKYRKHMLYYGCKKRMSYISIAVSFVVSFCLFAFGGFGIIDQWLRTYTSNPILLCLLFFGVYYIISFVMSLPFDIYYTFVIEEKFGFNRMTAKTYVGDTLKSMLINVLISGALLALFTWLYLIFADKFWLYAFIAVISFSLVMNFLYSDLIVPLFNKQEPLAEGELRSAIEKFATAANFKIQNIYVIDGSKRSTKANAYFSGFGSRKRVVLYDTLIDKMSTEEIVAVLAHEIGHYKHRHIWKSFLVSAIYMLFILYTFNLVIGSDAVAEAAGATVASFYINAMVFSLLLIPLEVVIDMLTNMISRRHERQADKFAVDHGYGHHLAEGLKKLASSSLSVLTPHPFVVFMEYSHPSLYERVQNADKK